MIGRFIDVTASLSAVTASCDGAVVARHRRSRAKRQVVNDHAHLELAETLRREHHTRREANARLALQHADGHTVVLRALPDYDALFGVDFDPTPDLEPTEGVPS